MSRCHTAAEDNSRSLQSGWEAMAWISTSGGPANSSARAHGDQPPSGPVLATKYSIATFMPTSGERELQKRPLQTEAIDHGNLLSNSLSSVSNESRLADWSQLTRQQWMHTDCARISAVAPPTAKKGSISRSSLFYSLRGYFIFDID